MSAADQARQLAKTVRYGWLNAFDTPEGHQAGDAALNALVALVEGLEAERDNNYRLYVAAINERDEWKECHHAAEGLVATLRDALVVAAIPLEALHAANMTHPDHMAPSLVLRVAEAVEAIREALCCCSRPGSRPAEPAARLPAAAAVEADGGTRPGSRTREEGERDVSALIAKHGSTVYIRLRKRDRKYLLIRFWTLTYGAAVSQETNE